MNSEPSRWSDLNPQWLEGSGIYRFGIACIAEVDDTAESIYRNWIESGRHGGLAYMEKYAEIRHDPTKLLDGAQSIICCAFPYYFPISRPAGALRIARYALGCDYHTVVRQRLETVAQRIRETIGGETRVCVDTAPLRERYWAVRSGLGFIGLNNQLILPGAGSYFFLGEILTTAALRPTPPLKIDRCASCGICVSKCPAGALNADGQCNASRCLSYLTIEHRGEFPPGTDLHGCFYGCDRCAEVCPHNGNPKVSDIEEFRPNPDLMTLTRDDILTMQPDRYAALFRNSPIKRAKLAGLQRNAAALTPDADFGLYAKKE